MLAVWRRFELLVIDFYGVDFPKMDMLGLILGLRPANERRRYKVTPSHIGWAQTWF